MTRKNAHQQTNAIGRGSPQTRTMLMDAALRVLDRKSFFAASVDDFVQEAGFARGTFYIYFKDRYDVLEALTRRLNEDLFEQSHTALDRSQSAFERLRLSLRRVIAAWQAHGALFRAGVQVAMMRPEFLAVNQELRLPFIRQIQRDIERSVAHGHARPIDPAVAAKALAAMMDWLCMLWFGLNEPPCPDADEDVERVADQLALLWYRAIYGDDPPEVDC